jgi:hypothetical protein
MHPAPGKPEPKKAPAVHPAPGKPEPQKKGEPKKEEPKKEG